MTKYPRCRWKPFPGWKRGKAYYIPGLARVDRVTSYELRFGGTIKERWCAYTAVDMEWFARRVDAKRWCEMVLARGTSGVTQP